MINAEMADIAELALVEAAVVARNARRGLARRGKQAGGKAGAALAELEILTARLGRVVAQTRLRLDGEMPEGATALVCRPLDQIIVWWARARILMAWTVSVSALTGRWLWRSVRTMSARTLASPGSDFAPEVECRSR